MKGKLMKSFGRTMLKVKKVGPEAMVIFGVAGITAATVMLLKKSDRMHDILDEHEEATMEVKEKELEPKEQRKEIAKVYLDTTKKVAKTYGPAASLYVCSAASILGGHNIVRKRYTAVTAAYKVLEQGFDEYRERVKEAVGEEREHEIHLGTTKKDISYKEVGEDGKEKEKKVKNAVIAPNQPSIYSRFFDEGSPCYDGNPEYDRRFLQMQQNYFNEILGARGHVFLNEVYDALGLQRSQAGAIVGWVKGMGDDYIDFGIFDQHRETSRDFVNGFENVILLDFNVDGVIYDLI